MFNPISLATESARPAEHFVRMPWEDAPPGKFTKGQSVKVKGILRSPLVGGAIHLERVVVLEAGPSTAIEMTADELLRSFPTPGYPLAQKYRDKTMILTGKIGALKPASGSLANRQTVVFMTEGSPWSVECLFSELQDKSDKPLVVGQPVKVIGEWSGFQPDKKVLTIYSCGLLSE